MAAPNSLTPSGRSAASLRLLWNSLLTKWLCETVPPAFPTPKVSDAKSANKAIKSAKERQFDMVLWSFREEELRRICVEDSAFDPLGKDKSQHGYLIGYTTPGLAQGENAPISIASWKSKKLRRKANSSLLCESMSGNISVAHWLWLTNLEMSLRYSGHRHGDRLVTTVEEEPTVLTKRVALAVDPLVWSVGLPSY